MEFAQQVRRRGAARDRDGTLILLSVIDGCSSRTARVGVAPDPDVAHGLRRALGVSGALGTHEHAAVLIPGDDRITRAGGPHLRQGGVGRAVTRIAGDQGAHEALTAGFGPVVPEPNRAAGNRSAVRVRPVVVDPAVIVRASDQDTGVPRIDRDRGFILASPRPRAFVQGRVAVHRPRRQRVRAYVSTGRLIMGQPDVGTG